MNGIIELDKALLLWVNGHHSPVADDIMWVISAKTTWIPLYILLVGLLVYRFRGNYKIIIGLLLAVGLAVGFGDFSARLIKKIVCRPRPTHDLEISGWVHIVRGYTGGLYGFVSNHACDTVTLTVIYASIMRNRFITSGLSLWVLLNCYSRLYMGAHFPLDILCGAIWGCMIAVAVYKVTAHFLPFREYEESRRSVCGRSSGA